MPHVTPLTVAQDTQFGLHSLIQIDCQIAFCHKTLTLPKITDAKENK
jgi:hypothetical protein